MPYVFNPFTGSFDDTVPLSGGKVPAQYLPSYVDDVEEYANLAAFPATGEASKIYLALDTSKIYRWSGSTYVIVGSNVEFLNDLSDVDTITAAPTDGQALVWEQATGKWEPGSVATTAQGALADTALQPTSSIDDLADVDTSTAAPTDGQVLAWDQTAGKWEPTTPAAGGSEDSVVSTAIPAYINSAAVESIVYVPQATWNAIDVPMTKKLYVVTAGAEGGTATLYYYPASFEDLPAIGADFLGGYFAGLWSENQDGVATHVLIVAPKTGGQVSGDYATAESLVITANTQVLGGYSDWKLPTKDELDICYQELKPTTAANSTLWGVNNWSVPKRTTNRTSSNPTQTTALLFRSGGGQDFDSANYWTTTVSGTGRMVCAFGSGSFFAQTLSTSTNMRGRLIRKVSM